MWFESLFFVKSGSNNDETCQVVPNSITNLYIKCNASYGVWSCLFRNNSEVIKRDVVRICNKVCEITMYEKFKQTTTIISLRGKLLRVNEICFLANNSRTFFSMVIIFPFIWESFHFLELGEWRILKNNNGNLYYDSIF